MNTTAPASGIAIKRANKNVSKSQESQIFEFKDHHLLYTRLRHEVRRYFNLNSNQYQIFDMVFCLSRVGYCTMSKDTMAFELGIDRATVFRTINMGIEKKLLMKQKGGSGLKTTRLWNEAIVKDDAGIKLLQEEKQKRQSQNATPQSQNATPNSRKMRPNTRRDTGTYTGERNAPEIELSGEEEKQLTEIAAKYNFLLSRKIKASSKELWFAFRQLLNEYEPDQKGIDNALEKFCSDAWRQTTGNNSLKLLFKADNFMKYSEMTDKQLEADNGKFYQKNGIHAKLKTLKGYYQPEKASKEVARDYTAIIVQEIEKPQIKTIEEAKLRYKGYMLMKRVKEAEELKEIWKF